MKIHNVYKWFTLCFTTFVLLTPVAKAQINPLLLKDEPEIYPLVYYGMSLDEFKQKLATRIFECKPNPNKAVADSGCKISFRFAGSGMSEGIGLFKAGKMVAFIARINTDSYPAVTQAVQSLLNASPQVETTAEKNGFFSSIIENEYTIWSYPNYQMIVSKFDIARYEKGAANFSLIVESDNTGFNDMMKEQSRKRSDIQIRTSLENTKIVVAADPTSTNSSETAKSMDQTPAPNGVSNTVFVAPSLSTAISPTDVPVKKTNSYKFKIEKKYDEFKKATDYFSPSI